MTRTTTSASSRTAAPDSPESAGFTSTGAAANDCALTRTRSPSSHADGIRVDGGPVDTDVLVVGAGPTGLMLANQLARRGVRTLIIDRHAGPARETRALGV